MGLPSWEVAKVYVLAAAMVGWTWAVWDVTSTYYDAKLTASVAEAQKQTLEDLRESTVLSRNSGVKYEVKRAAIQKKLTTPDEKLDEVIQSTAGDVVLPGELGMRLNELANAAEASGTASQPDGSVRSDAPVPDSVGSSAQVGADTRSQYGLSGRLFRAP